MKIGTFNEKSEINSNGITIDVILETPYSKEINISLREGQIMKKHKTPYPIVIHILEGEIDFGVEDVSHSLKKGSIVGLEGNIEHDLIAKADSIVRLTLSKLDRAERMEEVVKNSL